VRVFRVSSLAIEVIPAAKLKDVVDEITAIASTVDAGSDPAQRVNDVQQRLARLTGNPAPH
jgi:hypothetical protein